MAYTATSELELSTRCFDILVREVGIVDTERFIAFVNREHLDYTKWQQNLFAGQTIEQIAKDAQVIGARIRAQRASSNKHSAPFAK